MTDEQSLDLYNFIQQAGTGIADVFDQMEKGEWRDKEGHAVFLNEKMLRLKDVLETAINLNVKYYGA